MQVEDGERWRMEAGPEIVLRLNNGEAYKDHIEMSGERVSVILQYGTKPGGELQIKRVVVWPGLRTLPNNTHASLTYTFVGPPPGLRPGLKDVVREVRLNGMVKVESQCGVLKTTRWMFPSVDKPIYFELAVIENTGSITQQIVAADPKEGTVTLPEKGLDGSYTIESVSVGSDKGELPPGEHAVRAVAYRARVSSDMVEFVDEEEVIAELDRRQSFIRQIFQRAISFETDGDNMLSTMFKFAELRAVESVFRTRGGLMHSPGGGAYYAAVWANDQAEYAAPFFALLRGSKAFEATINMFRMYSNHMNDEFRPLPSSIIAEGADAFSVNGDRGDAAMVAYAAGRFALTCGDLGIANELWPLVEWCLEYCRRRTNAAGVVMSNTDELEGRFPTGDANLCTSSLTYDALVSASYLAGELDKGQYVQPYRERAEKLAESIERHFGARVEGFQTYRYFEGCAVLRSWICIPLTVGIEKRSAGTIDALFSSRLWTPDGLGTVAGSTVFWDRATLYGLRGAYNAGATHAAHEHFVSFSRRRLLGNHVPYPIEAFPEGNQQHLSAESALYCRVVTEGLFGMRPIGFRKFICAPRLPESWKFMALRNMNAFCTVLDIEVTRAAEDGRGLIVRVLDHNRADTSGQIVYSIPAKQRETCVTLP
mmetsp:Transcript_12237/g.37335  ORF Transcript_12237/g.37335 Transcript_12237/m.37335 type:complete len:653 (-) Transcript_12237:38-1996(-)